MDAATKAAQVIAWMQQQKRLKLSWDKLCGLSNKSGNVDEWNPLP
jgi:hypothetical protein